MPIKGSLAKPVLFDCSVLHETLEGMICSKARDTYTTDFHSLSLSLSLSCQRSRSFGVLRRLRGMGTCVRAYVLDTCAPVYRCVHILLNLCVSVFFFFFVCVCVRVQKYM